MSVRAITLVGAPILVSCVPFSGFVHDEVLDGPYRLVAVDTEEDMIVCLTFRGDTNSCIGDGLPEPAVFAAGANARHVVIARHPRASLSRPDRAITEYYYVVRTPDEGERGLPAKNVKGPFDRQSFEEEKRKLNLPNFSRVFKDLK